MNKVRLKEVCKLNPLSNKSLIEKKGTFLPMEKVANGSFDPSLEISFEEGSKGYTFMKNGDVIRAIVTPCFENGKGALLNNLKNGFAFGSTEFMCIRPKKIHPKFLYYITSSNDFLNFCIKSMKGVGGLRRISSKFALTYTIPNFQLNQQQAIANYLDFHTAKINNQVDLLEKKLLLLDEYKQSLMYETVTKGLDKNVPMKDSGIEWIGMIPEHWMILPFKKCFKERSVKNKKNESFITNNILSVMKDVGVINHRDKGDVGNKMSEDISNYKLVYPNDLVINKMNVTIGSLGVSKEFGALSVVYMVFKEKINNNNLYFNYLFKNRKWQKYLRTMATGILEIRESVDSCNFFSQPLVKPPLSEQKEIVNYLNDKCLKIDTNKKLLIKKIALFKEYKQSLIYEAVNGTLLIPSEFFNNDTCESKLYEDVIDYMNYFQKSINPVYEIRTIEDLKKVRNKLDEKND